MLIDPVLNVDYKNLHFDFEAFIRDELGLDLESQVKGVEKPICKYFLRNNCSNGGKCPFQHPSHRTREKSVVCKHWLRGLCKKGEVCEFLHIFDMKKMPECWFFSKYGECCNGKECTYQHIDPEKKQKDCPWYARGFCKHGPNCRHKHVRRIVCQNYLTGFCPRGLNCPNGHPKYELPNMYNFESSALGGDDSGNIPHRQPQEEEVQRPHINRPQSGAQRSLNQGQRRPLEEVTCFKCGQQGHYANKCPPQYS